MAFYFFELPKLPDTVCENDLLLSWLALFRAEPEEELKQIESLGAPELNQAIDAYHSIAASPEFQELERMRIKAQHDEAQALRNATLSAERETKYEIAKNALRKKTSVDDVIDITGLTRMEVEALHSAD